MPCSIEDCGQIVYAKGWCRTHYRRMYTYGRPHKIKALIRGNCTVEGCDKKIKGLGFCVNHYTLYKTYNLHPNQYNEMLKAQNYVCAICEEAETSLFHNKTDKVKMLAVDHCHKTNKIRALLCYRCNTFIGRVEESTELLGKMIDYLNKHKE